GRPAPDIYRSNAERRADPFVQVDADEIGTEVRKAEIQLADAVGGIDDNVDPAGTGKSSNLRDWKHQPGPMTEMSDQSHPDLRIRIKCRTIGFDERAPGRRLRKRDLDDLNAAQPPERFHARLHAVVVEVGVKDGIAGLQAIILEDQGSHRL